jgi:hypothetical protein
MAIKYPKWPIYVYYKFAIEYTNFFNFKALQNLTQFGSGNPDSKHMPGGRLHACRVIHNLCRC